jgi:hypothetical protein
MRPREVPTYPRKPRVLRWKALRRLPRHGLVAVVLLGLGLMVAAPARDQLVARVSVVRTGLFGQHAGADVLDGDRWIEGVECFGPDDLILRQLPLDGRYHWRETKSRILNLKRYEVFQRCVDTRVPRRVWDFLFD